MDAAASLLVYTSILPYTIPEAAPACVDRTGVMLMLMCFVVKKNRARDGAPLRVNIEPLSRTQCSHSRSLAPQPFTAANLRLRDFLTERRSDETHCFAFVIRTASHAPSVSALCFSTPLPSSLSLRASRVNQYALCLSLPH